jgi:hypothetical protein
MREGTRPPWGNSDYSINGSCQCHGPVTWRQLVREAPPSILAAALGIAPVTARTQSVRQHLVLFEDQAVRGHRSVGRLLIARSLSAALDRE